MANYLTQIRNDFFTAKKKLEKALDVTTKTQAQKVECLQNMHVTDELAEVFREKPVIIFQSMDIKFVQVNGLIMAALRALDRIDAQALKAIGIRENVETDRTGKTGGKKNAALSQPRQVCGRIPGPEGKKGR